VLLSILNILEQFELKADDARSFHLFVEACKFGYAQRGYYGDPHDPVYRNITELAELYSSKEYSKMVRDKIRDDKTFDIGYYEPAFKSVENHGTMHVSVLTKSGEASSLTSTVNLILGSRIMDNDTGIILNDEMDDFSIPGVSNAFGLRPSPYNFIYPNKRPLSSSVPVIVERDGVVMGVGGASGGSHIITATVQTVMNLFEFGMKVGDAVVHKRGHHQLIPNYVWVEKGIEDHVVDGLIKRGHEVVIGESGMSGVSAIKVEKDGLITGAGDGRKNGMAVGY
jgi:gamma-glutamyltranspeptidase / glutathione hydrolase / leukotriene-C4 hydrolase